MIFDKKESSFVKKKIHIKIYNFKQLYLQTGLQVRAVPGGRAAGLQRHLPGSAGWRVPCSRQRGGPGVEGRAALVRSVGVGVVAQSHRSMLNI